MTPKQINGMIEAHGAQYRQIAEQNDLLAWMTGAYVGRAFNPKTDYPNKPDLIVKQYIGSEDVMEEDDMKSILTAFAETHNVIEGIKNDD